MSERKFWRAFAIAAFIGAAIWIGIIYIVLHFVVKYW